MAFCLHSACINCILRDAARSRRLHFLYFLTNPVLFINLFSLYFDSMGTEGVPRMSHPGPTLSHCRGCRPRGPGSWRTPSTPYTSRVGVGHLVLRFGAGVGTQGGEVDELRGVRQGRGMVSFNQHGLSTRWVAASLGSTCHRLSVLCLLSIETSA
ncbi:hypothetical protein F5X68DRAFT_201657 [Plectosphaerella plurivora]|uniref:Uncharacterized protein n=1 Tax=Plectosphaerella plurivora TaxID=936078 RepID=A0A9P8VIC6_9PEZI|nr:hypothetical protein F5X68DRAFT_201657 [Plectosphaerella plurivora]